MNTSATGRTPIHLTLVTLLGKRTPVRLDLASSHAIASNDHGNDSTGNIVTVTATSTAAPAADANRSTSRKPITIIPADWTLSVTRAARGGTPFPRNICRNRLSRTASALEAVDELDAGANRSIAIHVLRPTGLAKHGGSKRPTVDKTSPAFQSWTFVAETQEKAKAARDMLRTWLGVSGHDAKCMYVVVNPNSGARHGQRLLEKIVKPMLVIAGIKTDVAISQHPHHATELARALPLANYAGALLVGGDGIVHEFWNGLLSHSAEPLSRASQFPIAHVGAGTGNGLAASLNMTPAEIAIHCAVKGWTRPFDMIEYCITPRSDVTNDYDNQVEHGWTHLSITHGWLADLDIESEVLRALGPLRTDVFALYRMFAQVPYGVRLGYVRPEDKQTALAAVSGEGNKSLAHTSRSKLASGTAPGWTMHPPDQFIMVNVHNLPHLSTDFNGCPLAQYNDGLMHLVTAHKISPWELLGTFLDQSSGQIAHLEPHAITPAVAVYIEPMHPTAAPAAFADHYPAHVPVDRFGSADPLVHHGHSEFVYDGRGLAKDDARWAKCRPKGHVVVDGEPATYGSVVAQIHPGFVRVFAPRDLDASVFASQVDQSKVQRLDPARTAGEYGYRYGKKVDKSRGIAPMSASSVATSSATARSAAPPTGLASAEAKVIAGRTDERARSGSRSPRKEG